MSTLLKIEFDIPEDKADEAGVFISSKTPHGWEEKTEGDNRHFTLYLEDHPLGNGDGARIPGPLPGRQRPLQTNRSPKTGPWPGKTSSNPVNCGETFRILPPWLEDDDDSATHIVIEPKMAFGTGHHPTTSLCLQTIGALAKKDAVKSGQSFLDLGTGSGILGIGLCKLGLTGTGPRHRPAGHCLRQGKRTGQRRDGRLRPGGRRASTAWTNPFNSTWWWRTSSQAR